MSEPPFRSDPRVDPADPIVPPEPPKGISLDEKVNRAWRMAWRAEQIALGADRRSLAMFEALGELQGEMSKRFGAMELAVKTFETTAGSLGFKIDQLSKKLPDVEKELHEIRDSSADLSDDVDKMNEILKHKPVDSERVKMLVETQLQVLVEKHEYERLKRSEEEKIALEKTQQAERRNFKLTTWGLLIAAIVTIIGTAATTYILEHRDPVNGTMPSK